METKSCKSFVHIQLSCTLNSVDTWTESASGSGSGVTSATHLGVPAEDVKHCGINVVEDVILTYATNSRLEKGQVIVQIIPD